MKKILAIVLTGIAVLCAAVFAEGMVGAANPWTEVAGMAAFTEATGIELAIPENAENVVLRVMNWEDGAVIGEMEFTLEGMTYTARTASSGVTDSIEDISVCIMNGNPSRIPPSAESRWNESGDHAGC